MARPLNASSTITAGVMGGGLEVEMLFRLLVALLTGMLIGIERERARLALLEARAKKRQQRATPRMEELVVKEFPGLRTFSLIALYSSLAGVLYSIGIVGAAGLASLILLFLVVVGVFTWFRLLVAKAAGITTVIVMLVDFILGLIAGLGYLVIAVSMGVLTTFILAIKIPVEKFVGRISYNELLWGLELGVILAVIGPFFLTQNISYYGVSLRGLYLFFALVLASSYLGYIAVRLRGAEGLAYLAFLGGFAHSEATLISTLTLTPPEERPHIGGHAAILANTSMVIRDMLIALAALAASGYTGDMRPIAAFAATLLLAIVPAPFSWLAATKYRRVIPVESVGNPLKLSTAVKSTLFYLLIAFTASILSSLQGGLGLLLVALIGGFVSSSATILALFTTTSIEPVEAAILSVYAIIAALFNKPVYAYIATGDARLAAKIAASIAIQAGLVIAALAVLSLISHPALGM